jgi:putative polyketide hydroxylase
VVLGYRYEGSPCIVPDGSTPPPVHFRDYVPSAHPGCLSPHAWLEDGSSLYDHFGTGFTLLAGQDGAGWRRVATRFGQASRVPLVAHTIGPAGDLHDSDGAWPAAYGVAADGAVLVRPDGYVAWRARTAPADPQDALATALGRVLGSA